MAEVVICPACGGPAVRVEEHEPVERGHTCTAYYHQTGPNSESCCHVGRIDAIEHPAG